MKTQHNPIKNKIQVTLEEKEHFRAQGVPSIRRVKDNTYWVNKKVVQNYRRAQFFKMIHNNSFVQSPWR